VELTFEKSAVLLLLIAAIVAVVTRRLRFPYSVGLVATGIAVALLPFAPQVVLTKDLIYTALLPPLLFEAAFYIRWTELRRELPVVLTLVTVGVLISAAITTAGMHFFAHWEWTTALLFGMLIAATDPVTVIATFREARARGRLQLLVESESLLNDGTAAVGFTIALAIASGQTLSVWGVTRAALVNTGGGILCGALAAYLVLFLMGTAKDHLVETACTAVAAYGSFFLADSLGTSGVFATITAGLLLGNPGARGTISERGREAVNNFWELAAFAANSVIFLLIGMYEANLHFGFVWSTAIIAVLLTTAGRAATIYPLCALFHGSDLRVSGKHQHVLFWGGLRGALALALVLGLPAGIPHRNELETVSFAVVAFSIFVNGLTVAPLLRALGEIRPTRDGADSEPALEVITHIPESTSERR
jgi:CPA1 family monovalent cation:H+ antiporter